MHHNNNNEIFSGISQRKLRRRIMRRVYLVWAIRQLLSPTMAKIILFVAIAKQLFTFVSVRDVIINSPPAYDFAASSQFFANAFLNTGVVVQASLIILMVMGCWFMYDFLKFQRSSGTEQYWWHA